MRGTTLLAACVLPALVGCGMWKDRELSDSRGAWRSVRARHPDRKFTAEFETGFHDGYALCADCGAGPKPPVQLLRDPKYLSAAGHGLANDYYSGFKYGSEVAAANGHGLSEPVSDSTGPAVPYVPPRVASSGTPAEAPKASEAKPRPTQIPGFAPRPPIDTKPRELPAPRELPPPPRELPAPPREAKPQVLPARNKFEDPLEARPVPVEPAPAGPSAVEPPPEPPKLPKPEVPVIPPFNPDLSKFRTVPVPEVDRLPIPVPALPVIPERPLPIPVSDSAPPEPPRVPVAPSMKVPPPAPVAPAVHTEVPPLPFKH